MTTPVLPPAPSPWRRIVAVGVGLAALVTIVVLAFSWPSVTSSAKDLPVAISGPDAAVTQIESTVASAQKGAIAFQKVDGRDAAVTAIKTRDVYGAIVLDGSAPEVLTASAASTVTSQLLAGLATQLQNGLTAATGKPVTVTVTDVVPLSSSDPRGAGLTAAAFPLTLGGMLGGIIIASLVVGAWRRIVSLAVYSIVGGAVLAAIMQGWFGSLQGDYIANAGAITLALSAIGATIVGFSSIVGRAGVAIGPIVFLLFANPISSATSPPEFLPQPWGIVGQWFPPGAASTLVRDLSYFPQAHTAFPWAVLSVWTAVGVAMGVFGHFRTIIAIRSAPQPDHAL